MRNPVELPVVGLRYNRYGKASATQDAVIEIRIYWGLKAKYLSTRIRVFPKEWKDGMVVNRFDAAVLNHQLQQLVIDVRQVIYEMYMERRIDIDAIPSRLQAKKKADVTFLAFCEERAKIRKYGKAADSQERYERFLRFLRNYGKFKGFYDLTETKVMELDRHLMKKNDMKAKSRWNNYHRFLNSFILDARKEGLLQKNPYDNVKIDHGDDSDGIDKFLFPDEFQKVREAKMSCERLEKVRDLFVFQTLTCLAYEDLSTFSLKKIRQVDLEQVLAGRRGKTNVHYLVPLLPGAIKILQKYGGLPTWKRRKKGDGILTNQKYNEYLKEVAKEAGVDRPVTTHWARHTGATLLLNLNVPLPIVSKVCGHSSTKITERIYAKLLDRTVVQEVMAVKDKL